MTAQTIVRQDVSVVKASIWSVRCRTRLEKTFNRIRGANRAMHDRRKGIKGEKMLFIDASAPYGFGIALLVFGECSPPN